MEKRSVRVRFAPSPTGFMHVGNVRAAIFNYLFARQNNGKFLVRIEDTDSERNSEESVKAIFDDLAWLDIHPDEEPVVQSTKFGVHASYLIQLQDRGFVYKCYCSRERLAQVKEEQIAAGKPPRYDGTCREVGNIEGKKASVWRLRSDIFESVTIRTLERGEMTFQMKDYQDPIVVREDGSFTFLFANAVDDIEMDISHVIRGQDHLSNTALQAIIYKALDRPLPTYLHLPLLGTTAGKKLSKRDKGSSLKDLKDAGFLAAPIIHYLISAGGRTIDGFFVFEDLWKIPLVSRITKASMITYDMDALAEINRRYLHAITSEYCCFQVNDYDRSRMRQIQRLSHAQFVILCEVLKREVSNLKELQALMVRVTYKQNLSEQDYIAHCKGDKELAEKIREVFITSFENASPKPEESSYDGIAKIKAWAAQENISLGMVLCALRYFITGKFKGVAIGGLAFLLTGQQILERIQNAFVPGKEEEQAID